MFDNRTDMVCVWSSACLVIECTLVANGSISVHKKLDFFLEPLILREFIFLVSNPNGGLWTHHVKGYLNSLNIQGWKMMRELVHTLKELKCLLVDLSTVPGPCWYVQKSYQTNINDVLHAMLFFFFFEIFYILVTKYVEVQIDIKDFFWGEKWSQVTKLW